MAYYYKTDFQNELNKIKESASFANSIGLETHIGHGITFESIIELSRIEEVKDYEANEFYYYIYCVKDTGVRIEIGKSKTKPQCYKQVSIYK